MIGPVNTFTNPGNQRKLDYYPKDLQDWANLCGVHAVMPPGHPISSVKAMRGGFGSPTIFIDGDDMYFGNDRLPLVEHRLRQLMSG